MRDFEPLAYVVFEGILVGLKRPDAQGLLIDMCLCLALPEADLSDKPQDEEALGLVRSRLLHV